MGISILRGGLQDTVQDLGRNGYAHLGISSSGAADAFSLRIGNLLVGNYGMLPVLKSPWLAASTNLQQTHLSPYQVASFRRI